MSPFANEPQSNFPITPMSPVKIAIAVDIAIKPAILLNFTSPAFRIEPTNTLRTTSNPISPRSPVTYSPKVILLMRFITPIRTPNASPKLKKPLILIVPPWTFFIAPMKILSVSISPINPRSPPTYSPIVIVLISFITPINTPRASAKLKNPFT